MSRDGFVSWEGSRYGVHWKWVGATVQVGERQGTVEIWAGRFIQCHVNAFEYLV